MLLNFQMMVAALNKNDLASAKVLVYEWQWKYDYELVHDDLMRRMRSDAVDWVEVLLHSQIVKK